MTKTSPHLWHSVPRPTKATSPPTMIERLAPPCEAVPEPVRANRTRGTAGRNVLDDAVVVPVAYLERCLIEEHRELRLNTSQQFGHIARDPGALERAGLDGDNQVTKPGICSAVSPPASRNTGRLLPRYGCSLKTSTWVYSRVGMAVPQRLA